MGVVCGEGMRLKTPPKPPGTSDTSPPPSGCERPCEEIRGNTLEGEVAAGDETGYDSLIERNSANDQPENTT